MNELDKLDTTRATSREGEREEGRKGGAYLGEVRVVERLIDRDPLVRIEDQHSLQQVQSPCFGPREKVGKRTRELGGEGGEVPPDRT